MEEERQRQEAEAKKAEDGDAAPSQTQDASGAASGAASGSADSSNKNDVGGNVGDMAEALDIDEEDEELLKALQMSMEENEDVDMAGNDPDIRDENFADELLDGLPGIDANDMDEIANMDELLEAVNDEEEEDKDKADQSKKDSDKK